MNIKNRDAIVRDLLSGSSHLLAFGTVGRTAELATYRPSTTSIRSVLPNVENSIHVRMYCTKAKLSD